MKQAAFVGFLTLVSVIVGYGQSPASQKQPAAPVRSTSAGPVSSTQAASPATEPGGAAKYRAVLDKYCVTCHNDRTKKANLTLEKLDLTTAGDHPELWEKVVRKLRAGVMPPPGMRRPPLNEYEGLRDWLETEIDRKAAVNTNPGS